MGERTTGSDAFTTPQADAPTMTEFSFTHAVDVRYQDYDMLGHVNNAVYVTYLEDARTAYLGEYADLEPADIEMVIAHLEVDYRRPVEDTDEVRVAVAVTDVGESSFTMAYEVRDDSDVAVEAESVQVAIDTETGESRPLPAPWRDAFDGITA
jgi:acyl-CoA thioester hydrolase